MGRSVAAARSGAMNLALLLWGVAAAPAVLAASEKSVGAGETWVVDRSVSLDGLTIAAGAAVRAPDGYSLTLTVNGTERDLVPGSYRGTIAVTATQDNPVAFAFMGPAAPVVHRFRQAIYLDQTGLVQGKSVLAAAGGYALRGNTLSDADIRSQGANFNGVYVAGGEFRLNAVQLNLEGDGGNDFAGWGAGIMSTGKDVRLVVDRAHVRTHGVVRTAAVADKGSKLIVTNSRIEAHDGLLPADYRPNTTPGYMRDVPWMLGLTGNCRATNLLGDDTVAAYINSWISADDWGVLSVDNSRNARLYAVNSKVEIRGGSGYGTYSIGNSTNTFLGSAVDVPDYGAIVTGGHVVFASSSAERVGEMNRVAGLGLSAAELAAISPAQTRVNSRRFGVMVWGNNGSEVNTVQVLDGTEFHTGEAFIIDRGAPVAINVDGSRGAVINSKNGIILQVMDLDKAPGVRDGGLNLTTGVYHDAPLPIARVADFDLSAAHAADVIANFAHIALRGDFYNGISTSSMGSGMMSGPVGPSAAGPGMGSTTPTGKNLVVSFDHATITGIITASLARHSQDTLVAKDVLLVSEVTNTPGAAVNNGVIVSLKQSTWSVTGTSYLTSLALDPASKIVAAARGTLTMTVDGVATPIKAGSYKGAIVLSVVRGG